MSNVDLTPTLIDGAGLPVPGHMQGRSFWSLLTKGDYSPRDEIFAEKTFHTAYEPMRAIRTRTHKLIVNFEVGLAFDVPGDVMQSPIYPRIVPELNRPRGHVELYDLTSDPWERTNLAGQPEAAELGVELRHRLHQWMIETNDPILHGAIGSPFRARAVDRLLAN